MFSACMRCHRLTDTTPYGAGLWLCAQCPLLSICAEFAHDYRARDSRGAWQCHKCATVLISQPLSTAIVPAAVKASSDIA